VHLPTYLPSLGQPADPIRSRRNRDLATPGISWRRSFCSSPRPQRPIRSAHSLSWTSTHVPPSLGRSCCYRHRGPSHWLRCHQPRTTPTTNDDVADDNGTTTALAHQKPHPLPFTGASTAAATASGAAALSFGACTVDLKRVAWLATGTVRPRTSLSTAAP
jgi:hypothetical protein